MTCNPAQNSVQKYLGMSAYDALLESVSLAEKIVLKWQQHVSPAGLLVFIK